MKSHKLKKNIMTSKTDKLEFEVLDLKFERSDGTFEIWYEVTDKRNGSLVHFVRPYRIQRILNLTRHLN